MERELCDSLPPLRQGSVERHMPAAIVRGAGYGEVLAAAAAFLLGVRDIRCRFSELALDIDGHR